jgi:uncharacterized protein with HEPN domain
MTGRSIKLLGDPVTAIDVVKEFIGNFTLDQYAEDLMLRSAVERHLEILREACSRKGLICIGTCSAAKQI